jgi:hypothetical protein
MLNLSDELKKESLKSNLLLIFCTIHPTQREAHVVCLLNGADGVFYFSPEAITPDPQKLIRGGMQMFEEEFNKFLDAQRRSASGQRLEQLHKDLTGEKKLMKEVLWPVLKSFDGLTMEHQLISTTGVKIYLDVFYLPLGIAFESEGFVVHAENITRERFMFERMRIRTIAMYGYKYIPFSWDELDKRAEACRRSVYELLGRFSSTAGLAHSELTVFEREVIRYALYLNRPLRLKDACYCLQLKEEHTRRVLRKLMEKKLIKPTSKGTLRHHEYDIEEKARNYML